MSGHSRSINQVAKELRLAYETADISILGELLDEKVTWGAPGDQSPPCKNRQQVLTWYQRGMASGASANVTDVDVIGNQILVGLVVRGTPGAREQGGHAARWQVFEVGDGHVVEIVGFDEKSEAVAWLSQA